MQAAVCPDEYSFEVQHPVDSGTLRQVPGEKLAILKQGWFWRSVEMYNTLPSDLRLVRKLTNFKKRVNKWVEENIKI